MRCGRRTGRRGPTNANARTRYRRVMLDTQARDGSSVGTGTLAFLFTDIAGSTRLWEDMPTAMADALARHDVILREAIESADGMVVKTTGDGMMAVFPTADEGVVASLAAQRALAASRLGRDRPAPRPDGAPRGRRRAARHRLLRPDDQPHGPAHGRRPWRPGPAVRRRRRALRRWPPGRRRACATSASSGSRTSAARSACSSWSTRTSSRRSRR